MVSALFSFSKNNLCKGVLYDSLMADIRDHRADMALRFHGKYKNLLSLGGFLFPLRYFSILQQIIRFHLRIKHDHFTAIIWHHVAYLIGFLKRDLWCMEHNGRGRFAKPPMLLQRIRLIAG
jgi:hypothetical protein